MTTRLNGSAPPLLAALFVLTAAPPEAPAQDAYPNRPIRIVLPVAPGGGTDALARLIGQGFLERWGRQVVVENRPGAGTLIASEMVPKSKPDGYTLLMTTSTHSISGGAEVVASAPEEYDAFIKTKAAKWAKVVQAAGIRQE